MRLALKQLKNRRVVIVAICLVVLLVGLKVGFGKLFIALYAIFLIPIVSFWMTFCMLDKGCG